MLPVSELCDAHLCNLSFLEYSHKETTMQLSKRQRQNSTDSPGLWIADTGRTYWGSSQLLPYTQTWGSFHREMRCCHSCFLSSDAARTWLGCEVQDCWVHQETPMSHSTDTLTVYCLTSYEMHARSYKKQRGRLDWTLWSLSNCSSSHFCDFLSEYFRTRTQVERQAYQFSSPSDALIKHSLLLRFDFLHAYKILPLCSFYFRSVF